MKKILRILIRKDPFSFHIRIKLRISQLKFTNISQVTTRNLSLADAKLLNRKEAAKVLPIRPGSPIRRIDVFTSLGIS